MNNTMRALAAVGIAVAALSSAGTAMADQGHSTGDIGSVARDESANFNSTSFGDAVNNGIGNILASLQEVGNRALL
ncbi:hypothetical protein [Streptomyces sp. NBC_00425]|uniref:hypothetical protein n=1 Tax=Streptomyces sp. NBC_00425 TaxID=2975740 RepID=UPI002E1E2664